MPPPKFLLCRRATWPRGIYRRLAIEANPPPMYTIHLNGTAEAFSLVKRLDNPGLAVNLTCPPCWPR